MTVEAILTTTESKDLHLAKEQALLHMLKDDTMIYRDYTMDKGLIRSSREWDTIGRCLRSAYVTVTGIRDAGRSSCQVADERSSLFTSPALNAWRSAASWLIPSLPYLREEC